MEPLAFKGKGRRKNPALLITAIKATKWEEKSHSLCQTSILQSNKFKHLVYDVSNEWDKNPAQELWPGRWVGWDRVSRSWPRLQALPCLAGKQAWLSPLQLCRKRRSTLLLKATRSGTEQIAKGKNKATNLLVCTFSERFLLMVAVLSYPTKLGYVKNAAFYCFSQ